MDWFVGENLHRKPIDFPSKNMGLRPVSIFENQPIDLPHFLGEKWASSSCHLGGPKLGSQDLSLEIVSHDWLPCCRWSIGSLSLKRYFPNLSASLRFHDADFYSLVNCHIAMERSTHAFLMGKIHYFDWAIFHCKLLVHQRVSDMFISSHFPKKTSRLKFSARHGRLRRHDRRLSWLLHAQRGASMGIPRLERWNLTR